MNPNSKKFLLTIIEDVKYLAPVGALITFLDWITSKVPGLEKSEWIKDLFSDHISFSSIVFFYLCAAIVISLSAILPENCIKNYATAMGETLSKRLEVYCSSSIGFIIGTIPTMLILEAISVLLTEEHTTFEKTLGVIITLFMFCAVLALLTWLCSLYTKEVNKMRKAFPIILLTVPAITIIILIQSPNSDNQEQNTQKPSCTQIEKHGNR